jgi:hypothetical protein
MDNSKVQTQEYSIEDVKKQAHYLLYVAQFTKDIPSEILQDIGGILDKIRDLQV